MSIEVRNVSPPSNLKTSSKRSSLKLIGAALSVVAIAAVIGNYQVGATSQNDWSMSALQGKVAMTEVQLKKLVSSESLTVYWTGPMTNTLYTLNSSKKNQIVLTYLPQKSKDKKVIADTRVIGTYFSPNAFSESLTAASKKENISFRNSNGNVVFYPKLRTTGVFVAIPSTNYQIEIYDPIPGQAISIASLRDQLTKIGS